MFLSLFLVVDKSVTKVPSTTVPQSKWLTKVMCSENLFGEYINPKLHRLRNVRDNDNNNNYIYIFILNKYKISFIQRNVKRSKHLTLDI